MPIKYFKYRGNKSRIHTMGFQILDVKKKKNFFKAIVFFVSEVLFKACHFP